MKHLRRVGVWLLLSLSLLLFVCCGTNTEPLSLSPRALCVARGGEHPAALDFLCDEARTLCMERGVAVTFDGSPDFSSLGERTAVLSVGGERVEALYRVVEDTSVPTLLGVCDRSVLLGEGVILLSGVSAEDDCFGAVDIRVETGNLDTARPGFYEVTYHATDGSGNQSTKTVHVTVYAEEISREMLDAACRDYLAELIPAGLDDREQICRLIFQGVQERISYFPVSDKTSPVRAAYLAMFRDGRGDCYSYFASARALLEYVGVEYLTVERTSGVREDTHYWLMVNLAKTGESERWYHFDPTELDTGDFDHDGCLFTDAELDAYNAYNVGFYDYDRAAYPRTEERSLRTGGDKP